MGKQMPSEKEDFVISAFMSLCVFDGWWKKLNSKQKSHSDHNTINSRFAYEEKF